MEIRAEDVVKARILGGGGGGVTPTGTLDITDNGTYDVTNYAEAEVAVPLPSGKKQITISDVDTVTEDVTDYEEVEISTSGLVKPTGNKTITITEPGTVSDIDVSGEATASVTTQGLVKPTGTLQITENGAGIDVSQYASVDVDVSGGGTIFVWDNRGIEYNSWEKIQQAIQLGLASSLFNVGDTKTFVINDVTYEAEVVAINDGTGDAGQWYPDKTVDFITKQLYSTAKYRSTANNTGGFANSGMPTTLNSTYYTNLPSDLKAVIIEKSHSYQVGEYFGSAWQSVMSTFAFKLWLPTAFEIKGYTSVKGENATNNKQYTMASDIKQVAGGNAAAWWLGSPYTSNGKQYWYVGTNGTATSGNATTLYRVPICFRIG